MDTLQTLTELYRHMEWADATLWAAVLARPEAAEDPALRERLYHIHMVQRGFLQVWRTGTFTPTASDSFSDTAALLAWGRAGHLELNEYLSALGGMDSERPIVMPWIEMFEARMGRKADVPTFQETLLQVIMHSTYHRGQVSTRLRELGGEPPLTDYIVWIWRGKPQPDWPQATAR
jgi:uncharacterized damage-inducible protein DinB